MEWLTAIRSWPWELLGPAIAAVAGAIWSVYTFARERREDRKWKQVEFLLEVNQKFFENTEIRECIRKLDDTHQHKELERVFNSDRSTLTSEEVQFLEKFRSLFQFFDNLAQCLRMEAMTLEQISLFGWYLQRIGHAGFLRKYCEENGFSDVIDLAGKIERYAYIRR